MDWHVSFALEHKALIVVQDRDWSALPVEAREKVRQTQRPTSRCGSRCCVDCDPSLSPAQARAAVHATFGLINSTPHSAVVSDAEMSTLLGEMALRALLP